MSPRKRLPKPFEPKDWRPGYRFEHKGREYEVWDEAPRTAHDGVCVWVVPMSVRPWDAPVYLFRKGGRYNLQPTLLPFSTDGEVAS